MAPAQLKILLVSGVYPPAIGGPSLQTQQIAQRLMARGVTVQVVTYGDPDQSGVVDGVPLTFVDGRPQSGWLGKLGRNWRIWQALNRMIEGMQPSVIHMQTAAGNLALMTGLAARRHGIPALLKYTADLVAQKATLADFAPPPDGLARRRHWMGQRAKDDFQRSLFALYTHIWATTPAFQTRLQQHYQVPASKCWLMPNFIDLQPFTAIAEQRAATATAPKSTLELLTVARLFPVKGLDVYLQALAQLSHLPLRVRLVGSGSIEYQHSLQTLATDLGLADRVEFTGAIAPAHIAAAYATADLFVLPSRHEPFGIVLIEAMAVGLPIVATAVDGIPYVVEAGKSAWLVPPGDATALAIAVQTLVTSPAPRQALAAAGRIRAQAFALEPGVQNLLALYQHLSAPSATVPRLTEVGANGAGIAFAPQLRGKAAAPSPPDWGN
ncbi:glycosyltransferase family 4 protein [Halomicronema sp. CCY15110]|uniref:glycosyltransferase family 4 protein n=1 Tax=Halomicronema sp. CCY15110 TaxID=2767773 RepID=UPI00195180FA|nr:glycosyltransferase family 4 protein [Halomicronema sp. CCY15110]